MDIQRLDLSPETILQRIDTILRELEALRKMVAHTCVEPATDNQAQQLYGVLGRGTWDEYDRDLDWQRFSA